MKFNAEIKYFYLLCQQHEGPNIKYCPGGRKMYTPYILWVCRLLKFLVEEGKFWHYTLR